MGYWWVCLSSFLQSLVRCKNFRGSEIFGLINSDVYCCFRFPEYRFFFTSAPCSKAKQFFFLEVMDSGGWLATAAVIDKRWLGRICALHVIYHVNEGFIFWVKNCMDSTWPSFLVSNCFSSTAHAMESKVIHSISDGVFNVCHSADDSWTDHFIRTWIHHLFSL